MRTVTSRNLIVNSRLRVSKEKLTCQIRTWQYEQSWAAGAGRKRVRLMCTEMLVVCIWQFQISPSVWCATAGSFKLTDRFEFAGLCPELLYLSVRCWIFSWYDPWRVWWISVTKAVDFIAHDYQSDELVQPKLDDLITHDQSDGRYSYIVYDQSDELMQPKLDNFLVH